MTLLDDAVALTRRSHAGPVCIIAKMRESDPALAAELAEAIEGVRTRQATAPKLIEAFTARNTAWAIDKNLIYRHTHNECLSCRS